jgi:FkbM family methyltransferase
MSNLDKTEQPDAWLYNRSVLAWMSEPALSEQLPELYQIFSNYCRWYFALTDEIQLKGGRELFSSLSNLYDKFAPESYLKFSLSGYEVFLDPLDGRFFQVVNEFTSPHSDVKVLSHLITKGDTFIDIGANHGSFSIVASQLVGSNGYVVAVEPQPRLAKAVEQSLKANAKCSFRVYPIAVGDTESDIELLIPRGTSGSAGLYPEHSATHEHQVVKVAMKRFDDFVDWQSFPGKTVLKLDIEGSECAFLLGAHSMITNLKPDLIIEIHPGTLKASRTSGETLKNLLQELGYKNYSEIDLPETAFPIEDLSTSTQRNVVLRMQ